MDGSGGCCIARYAGGAYDTSKVDRIMLRFRPIAPKPAMGGSVSGVTTPDKSDMLVRSGRTKRRYVRDKNKQHIRKRRSSPEEKKRKKEESEETIVTLPLLPETPELKEPPVRRSVSDLDVTPSPKKKTPVEYLPAWLNLNNDSMLGCGVGTGGRVVTPQTVRIAVSCVTMECVTDAWLDGGGLGSTDAEKRKSLEGDTCPGFISDGLNRVQWTNEAYRRMVGQGEMIVWLVIKQRLPVTYPAFACRVRLQYTCGKDRNSLTVPCDVWRMDGGGFAWRLDVKAALSLGR